MSATGDTADEFVEQAPDINPSAPDREIDMLISAEARIAASLVALGVCPGFRGYSPVGKKNTTTSGAADRRVVALRGVYRSSPRMGWLEFNENIPASSSSAASCGLRTAGCLGGN
jgi:hypothetical protein